MKRTEMIMLLFASKYSFFEEKKIGDFLLNGCCLLLHLLTLFCLFIIIEVYFDLALLPRTCLFVYVISNFHPQFRHCECSVDHTRSELKQLNSIIFKFSVSVVSSLLSHNHNLIECKKEKRFSVSIN